MTVTGTDIRKLLPDIPLLPGVYLMKDSAGEIIYIGKASSLRKRVSSYFAKTGLDTKTRVLVSNIADIEYIVTDSEVEALILESSLVRKHKPKYNIRLKDDKRYPYIAVTLSEDYPRIIITRKLSGNGDRFFGPYTDASAARRMVTLINRTFKLKTCRKPIPLREGERPCLNFQIKRCLGTCQGTVSKEEYREIIDNVLSFLGGDIDPVIAGLKKLMDDRAGKYDYEGAAQIRDIIFDIQKISETQKVYAPVGLDQDFAGISMQRGEAVIVLMEFRKGILLGRKITVYGNIEYSAPEEILRTFLIEYYGHNDVPQKIVTALVPADRPVVERYLTDVSCRNVSLAVAKSPEEKGIMRLLQKNMDVIVAERESKHEHEDKRAGLRELQDVLMADADIVDIECFDISNIQGKYAVASMVHFTDGVPDKSQYRRFRIRSLDSPNDPAMIHEVVGRRLQYLMNEGLAMPDLMVIDGGITQLARAREAAESIGADVRIVSLAKRFEEIFTDPKGEPVRLGERSPGRKILQNIRDEAHRFAITYHRKLRDKGAVASRLDGIPGIGARRKRILFEHFKSVDNIIDAEINDIAAVPGIGKSAAEKVYRYFHDTDVSGE